MNNPTACQTGVRRYQAEHLPLDTVADQHAVTAAAAIDCTLDEFLLTDGDLVKRLSADRGLRQ